MKKTILSLIVMVALCTGIAYSQVASTVRKVTISEKDKAILNEHIREYSTFTMDKRELIYHEWSEEIPTLFFMFIYLIFRRLNLLV